MFWLWFKWCRTAIGSNESCMQLLKDVHLKIIFSIWFGRLKYLRLLHCIFFSPISVFKKINWIICLVLISMCFLSRLFTGPRSRWKEKVNSKTKKRHRHTFFVFVEKEDRSSVVCVCAPSVLHICIGCQMMDAITNACVYYLYGLLIHWQLVIVPFRGIYIYVAINTNISSWMLKKRTVSIFGFSAFIRYTHYDQLLMFDISVICNSTWISIWFLFFSSSIFKYAFTRPSKINWNGRLINVPHL